MNRTIWLGVKGAVCFALLAATNAVWPEYRAQVAASSAIVTSLYGDVQVRRGTSGWSRCLVNAVLNPGDAIKTGSNARAELTVRGSGYVRLDQNTHLLIRYLSDTGGGLKALVGGVWVSIERALVGAGGFRVEMPSAVASVKGTVFRCLVDEQGNCETAVYDGEVECEADGKRFAVGTAKHFARPHGGGPCVKDLDVETDTARDWVVWNRRKDVLGLVGSHRIVVALAEYNGQGRLLAPVAVQRLSERLLHAGLGVEVLPPGKVPDKALDQALVALKDGTRALAERLQAAGDVLLVGELSATTAQPVATGTSQKTVYAARAACRAALIDLKEGRLLFEWDGRSPGQALDPRMAAHLALHGLADRFAEEVIPRLLECLMLQRRVVHVELSGVPTGRDLFAFTESLRADPRVRRVIPFKFQPGYAVMGVATDLPPNEVGRLVGRTLGGQVQLIAVEGPVVTARMNVPKGPAPAPAVKPRLPLPRPTEPARAPQPPPPPWRKPTWPGGRPGPR